MKDWTIMVYMAGDNNLSGDMAFDLEDLNSASGTLGSSDRRSVNTLVYFDSNAMGVPTLFIDYSGETPFYEPVRKDPEHSASANSILNFIRWCVKRPGRKAKNYALIFSGHSFGFYGISFLRDESTGRNLSLRRFRWALDTAKRKYLGDKPIAIVGFDSCQMSMLEVGSELRGIAHTIVASEGSIPNSGWGYAPLLRQFAANPQMFVDKAYFSDPSLAIDTPQYVKLVAKSFVTIFLKYRKNLAIGGGAVDIAAWDIDEIGELTKAVGSLGKTLLMNLGLRQLLKDGKLTESEALLYNQTRALILQSRVESQAYMQEQAVDLKDFCQKLLFECKQLEMSLKSVNGDASKISELGKLCRSVLEAADRCILQTGYCGDEYQFSKGISLYFPWTALTFRQTSAIYFKLRFYSGVWEKNPDHSPENRRVARYIQIEEGEGKAWGEFLLFYLFFVTFRQNERNGHFESILAELEKGGLENGSWEQTKRNWRSGANAKLIRGRRSDDVWPTGDLENWTELVRGNWPVTGSRDDWPVNRDDWPVNRDDWPVNRDDWPVNRDDWPVNRDDWPVNRDDWPVNRDDWPVNRNDWPVNRDDWPMNRDDWPVNRDDWPVNRDDWPVNRDDWPVNRDDWPVNRDDWPVNRDDWPVNRDDWPVNRDDWPVNRGDSSNYKKFFGRVRNAQIKWNAFGVWPEDEPSSEPGDEDNF